MEPTASPSQLRRLSGLRGGIVIGVAVALVGIGVGTATGAVTPFQMVVIKNTTAEPVPVAGTVNVGNTPANQNVTVSNFPATQPVAITNIAPAEVADNVFSAARGFEPGSRSFPFGKTINVTTLIVAEGDSGFFDVYLSMPSGDELVLVKDTRDHFSQGFTMPVPATGVRVVCTNVVLTCSINVSAFGY